MPGIALGVGRRLRQRRGRAADRRAGRRPRGRARDRLGGTRCAECARAWRRSGEIGLTGRLRPAAQSERRLEECAKLGVSRRSLRRALAACSRSTSPFGHTSRRTSRLGWRRAKKPPQIGLIPKSGAFPGISAILSSHAGELSRPAGFFAEQTHFHQGEAGLFEVGDKVVYPHHGAGTVVKKEKRESSRCRSAST